MYNIRLGIKILNITVENTEVNEITSKTYRRNQLKDKFISRRE